ncbi:MAG: hypothetical protein KH073_07670 [Clostridium sp.]|uniref:hypothetical protein n=1 Tax=Clostridium TaxID=1485 RepID=UPI0006E645EF|nr:MULTISPECIES: hypothetical protein [Clostridium]KQB76796.1 hypothetical protein AK964_21185 [Clostridium butyricum]MBS4840777.1 hypothetical protein [Clostridium sp.]MDB2137619.1 hypothetical protein [Clostridium butyricum]
MDKNIKVTIFYGTGDFTKIFNNLIEDKIRNIEENIKNERYNKSNKCYSSAVINSEVDVNE